MANKKYKAKYQKMPKGFFRGWVLLLLVALSMGGVGTVVAKYVTQSSARQAAYAPSVYFSSKYLTESGKNYKLNSNTTELTLTVSNADMDQPLDDANTQVRQRVSELDVSYSITVTRNGTTVQSVSDTLPANVLRTPSVTLSGMAPGDIYHVEATANVGNWFSKKLSATFEVTADDGNAYYKVDTSQENCTVMTVWTHNTGGTLTVGYPAGLIPDNTDAALANEMNLEGNGYGSGSFEVTGFQPYSSRSFRFFRDENSNSDNFDVSITDAGDTVYLAAAQ